MIKKYSHTVYLPTATGSSAKLGRFLSITDQHGNVQQISLPGSVSRYHVAIEEGASVTVKLGYPTKDNTAAWDTLGWTDPLKLLGGQEINKSFNSWAKKVTVADFSPTLKQAAGVSDWQEVSDKSCTYPSCGCDEAAMADCGVTTTLPPVVAEPTEEEAEIAPQFDDDYAELESEDEVSAEEVEEDDEVEVEEDEVSEDEISEDEEEVQDEEE